MNIKKQLLESLIRVCAKEVLSQLNEGKKSKKTKKCKCGQSLILGANQCKECLEETGLTSENNVSDKLCDCGAQEQGEHEPHDKGCAVYNKNKVTSKPDWENKNEEDKLRKGELDEEDSETIGAAQTGSGDSIDIETDSPKIDAEPSEPETPKKKEKLKGIVLLTPEGELRAVPFRMFADEASIERTLHRVGSAIAGRKVKVSISAMRAVKKGFTNPKPTYVYLGTLDPQADELFLFANSDLNTAKTEAATPEKIKGEEEGEIDTDSQFLPHAADEEGWGKHLSGADRPHNDLEDDSESGQD